MLKLQSPTVLLEVARYAETTDNPQLRLLYQRLMLELRIQLNSAIPSRAGVGSLIVNKNLRTQIQKRLEQKQTSKS